METSTWHYDYVRLAWDSGFCFDSKKAKCSLDWSSIGLLDIEKVITDRDIAVIEKFIPVVLEFKLDEDLTRILEPNFVKIFKLSQLSMQYLIFCKKYLDNTVAVLKKELAKSKESITNSNQREEEYQCEISNLKRKLKELKSVLEYYPIYTENTFKCPECTKMFATEDFLNAHIKRRHESISLYQTETDKLQMEIKQLKEQLNSTEKYSHPETSQEKQISNEIKSNETSTSEHSTRVRELQDKFDKLKEHVESELKTVNDQKYYLEKYEKWMEMAFQKFSTSQKELYEPTEKVSKRDVTEGDFIMKIDSFTQTSIEEMPKLIPEAQQPLELTSAPVIAIQNYDEVEKRKNSIDQELNEIIKLQQQIKEDTSNQIEHFEEVVQEKITSSLQKLESQMNTFWTKLNELQLQKFDNVKIPKAKYETSENSNTYSSDVKPVKITQKTSKQKVEINNSQLNITKVQKQNADIGSPIRSEEIYSQTEKSETAEESHESPKMQPKPAPRRTLKKMQSVSVEIKKTPKQSPPAKPRITSVEKNKKSSDIKNIEMRKRSSKKSPPKESNFKRPILNVGAHMKKTFEPERKPIKTVIKLPIKVSDTEETESSSSETEESPDIAPNSKPSNTSTLAKHSITSLKQAMQDETVTVGLRKELQVLLSQRLEEVGVSPKWSGLPEKSYKKALRIILHQGMLVSKNFGEYSDVRENILKHIESQIASRKTVVSKDTVKKLKREPKKTITKSRSLLNIKQDIPKVKSKLKTVKKSPRNENESSMYRTVNEEKVHQSKQQKVYQSKQQKDVYCTDVKPVERKSMYGSSEEDTILSVKENPKVTEKPNLQKTQGDEDILQQKQKILVDELKQAVLKHKETSSSEELEILQPVQSKSMLKTSTAATTLAKKKVLFDLESISSNNANNYPVIEMKFDGSQEKNQTNEHQKENSGEISKSSEVKIPLEIKPIKQPILIRTGDSESTSIGSSVLEMDAARSKFKPTNDGDASPKINVIKVDDGSDWDISDILSNKS